MYLRHFEKKCIIQKVKEHCCLPDGVLGKTASGCSQSTLCLVGTVTPVFHAARNDDGSGSDSSETTGFGRSEVLFPGGPSHSSQSFDHVIHVST